MRKRVIILFFTILFFFAALSGRIGYLSLGNTVKVADSFHSYSVVLDYQEPNIYTADGKLLTNNQNQYCVVLRPNESTFSELHRVFSQEELPAIVTELEKGYPLVKNVKSFNGTQYLKPIAINASDSSCRQLIDKASSGLLQYMPDSVGSLKMNFSVDALGRVLSGDDGTIIDHHYHSREGVKTSINSSVQSVTAEAMAHVSEGCAVVMDVNSSEILACVNKPDETYLNKSLRQYAVGSVFKIVVAACAIENGMDPAYVCSGKIRVGDTTFSCYEEHVHGKQHLKEALGNSCNCYFVNLGLQLGAEKLLTTAQSLGFDGQTVLFSEWSIDNAELPSAGDLQSKGELSLFSFGQGKLTATPLHFCSLMAAIARQGYYAPPQLVTATVDTAGRETSVTAPSPKAIMTAECADLLLRYLRYVVAEGNAASADYHHQSAGKTATAQTGQYDNGTEMLNCWFAGVYPYDHPQYAIVIMVENGEGGARECCPIFRTIVENLDQL